MNEKPGQLVCLADFVKTEVFPSKTGWKDFSILEASGREGLLSLLKKEFPEAAVESRREGKPAGNRTFDYIVASGLKYLPDSDRTDRLFRELIRRLKPRGKIAARVCGFPGYQGLVMLGSIISRLSQGKSPGYTLKIGEAVIARLPAGHPVFRVGDGELEAFVQRLKSRDEQAFKELLELSGSIGNVDRLFTVSRLMVAVERWGGHFARWVLPRIYEPSSPEKILRRLESLPPPRRSIVSSLLTASPA
ncbi:MAG: class I SAM-dependent methyltransferase, partial [bacterium]|nr:class I SAM-dependent methyltransferase [bacterium]